MQPTSESQLEWVVYDVQLPSSDVSFLGSPVGVVVRMRLQVVATEHFGARVGQLTTRGPPFAGRLDVDGLVWDRSATKVARSTSLADERALLRQIDVYVGGGGGEWAGERTHSKMAHILSMQGACQTLAYSCTMYRSSRAYISPVW